ncbi:ras GEF [Choiromyces venosus 120613-1]|uniref:Ras GEF n=1 Tax=Choiromyces venosus 120613-1 TaxID=1336337 RepID=A0A3N4K517_9PEZI|nr:ras GEF [Choiromyces venosus 120613-1]
MITATGAGASFCAVPPKRLKPKSPRNPPPNTRLNQHSRNPSPPSPLQSRSVPPHGSTPSSQSFLLSRTNSLPTTIKPSSDRHLSLLDTEDFDRTSGQHSFVEEDFFGLHPLSASSLESGHEPPSPRSFYSAATTSSASTTKAGGGRSSEEEYSVTPIPPTQLQQPPSLKENRKLGRPARPSSPPSSSSSSLGNRVASGSSSRSHGIGSFASYSSSHLSGHSPTLGPQHGEQTIIRDFENMSPNNSIRDLCIAVVGAKDVGKSTFIQKAYDLKAPPNEDAVTAKLMTVERSLCTVKLVEIDLAKLDLDSQQLIWPRTVDGQRLPFVDGVFILYDVTNPASIAKLPESLDAFARAALPTLVVSCKCDAPQRQLNPNSIEQVGIVGGYDTMQTSGTSPDSQKKCLAVILGMIARKNEKSPRNLNGRRRANSSATNNSRTTSPRPSTARSGHSRASSEFSTTYMKEYPEVATQSAHAAQARIPRSPINPALGALGIHSSSSSLSTNSLSADTRGQQSSGGSAPQITLSASPGPLLEVVSTSPFSMQQPQGAHQTQNGSPLTCASSNDTDRGRNSFLDMDDENDGLKDVDDIPILEREGGIEDFEEEKTTPSKGFTFDELVDRLLRQHMSRGDQDFTTIFLCFYRKFAPPRDLLNAILERFERSSCDQIALHRISAQLRYCNILHQWVSTHPGDFAHPKTRQRLLNFLDVISSNRRLALLVCEMKQTLGQGIEDEDGVWARSDSDTERKDSLRSFLTTHSVTDSLVEGEGGYIGIRTTSEGNLQIPSDKESNLQASEVMSSASVRTCDATSSAHQPLLQKPGDSVLDGATMWKEQYDLFMSIPDDEIAAELTRIDWLEFSSIRCRDLVRHVSIPADQKEKYPSLTHVNRMISHFNHVAYWVASVILEKPKAKHRARALEKFMNVAWTLRHMNNYNALGAVIAGINGTAVHRLSLTRELVNPSTHRQFMRLELLMGTHMSHSKYRLAWENTSTERIPFIPLHRRDLVSADEGNRTFLADGDKINWNKFQVMGDVLMVIVKSQATPYRELIRNHIVEKLITDAVLRMNDDELYERSVQLENVGGGEKTRRRIWFQR